MGGAIRMEIVHLFAIRGTGRIVSEVYGPDLHNLMNIKSDKAIFMDTYNRSGGVP